MSTEKTKLLTIKEGNEFRIEVSKISDLAEINNVFDELVDQSKNYTLDVEEIGVENLTIILEFFSNLKNVPFNLTAPFVTCYDQLLVLRDAGKGEITYDHVKVIQTMLVGASWDAKPDTDTPMSEGKRLLLALKSLEKANIELGAIEHKIQIAGHRVAEVEQEIATGLKTKAAAEDDTTSLVNNATSEVNGDA